MTRKSTIRRIVASAAVTAMPITTASALLTAQPAAAQFAYPGVSPFGTSGFYGGGGIVYAPDNSTTEINNYGSGNTTIVDDGSYFDDGYHDPYWGHGFHPGHDWDFPWWDDDWSWHPGWDDGWNGGWW